MTDFTRLEQDIREAAKQAFTELAARSRPGPLCAFALYSDDGAMTVCPAANTATHLVQATAGNPEFRDDYEFSPAEWKYESEGAEAAFDAICVQLQTGLDQLDDDETTFVQFRQRLFTACRNALQSLKEEGFFEAAGAPVLLLFQVSDADITRQDVTLVKALNEVSTAARFESWARTFNEL